MDRIIENDTKHFRWPLSKSESRELLGLLFPDSMLFANSQITGMSQLLKGLRKRGLYARTTAGEELWSGFPNTGEKNAEVNMATFLNNVIEMIEKIFREEASRVQRTARKETGQQKTSGR